MQALIVDDNPTNAKMLQLLIGKIDGCTAICFTDPVLAQSKLATLDFDIALVDYVMPGMDGLQFVQAIRAHERHRHVPVIIITTAEDRNTRIETIEAGANDFLSKPVDPVEFKARVRNMLALRRAQIALADRAGVLQGEVDTALKALTAREEEIIWRLSRATERRDTDTGSHIMRMATICRVLAEELGFDAETCRSIHVAAQMHDIGKVGIPDHILFKPGLLTPEERTIMQRHTTIGADVLAGSEAPLVRIGCEIASTHHERWDGTGYPLGLAGTDIPIAGRIAAVADVFDALVSPRPYKNAWTFEAARDFIVAGSGTQFDPTCVRAFERRFPEILSFSRNALAQDVCPEVEEPPRQSVA